LEPTFRARHRAASISAVMGTEGIGEAVEPNGGARAMGVTIRLLRRHAGLSQPVLGTRSGMHHNYIGALERGKVDNPGLATLSRVAQGLGASIGVLAASYASSGATQLPVGTAVARRRVDDDSAYDGSRELGRAIRLLRRRLELTQGDLSDLAGLHRSYVSSIEAGKKQSPGLRTVTRIARGLVAHPAELSTRVAELAKVFTGELTVDELRQCDLPTPSGSPGPLQFPLGGLGP
jgi:transcriptional regulator with XRE-family HTH domain